MTSAWRCRACEYGEYVPDGESAPCMICGQPMERGDALGLKDTQSDRGTNAQLRAAGYRVGSY